MKYLLLLPILLLLSSCKNDDQSNEIKNIEAKQINLVESLKKENLANYIKDIEVVKLDTKINLIGIDKVVFYNHQFYTLDKKTSNLIVFDSIGKFLRKIGERGNGPGEYKKITDFEIDKTTKQIVFLSEPNRAIYKFSLIGEFIEKINLSFFVHGFVISNDGTYVFMSGRSSETFHTLTRTDAKGNIISLNFPFPKNIPIKSFAYTGGIHKQGNSNYFTEATSSLIYEIEDSISPLYQFNFGKNIWKEEDKYNLNEFTKENNKSKISYLHNYYCDTDKILAFNFRKGRFYRKGFYFKESQKVIAVPHNLEDSFAYRLLNTPIGIKDNRFISSLNNSLYSSLITSEKASQFKESYKKLYNTLYNDLEGFLEYDNPYLLIYEIKDVK